MIPLHVEEIMEWATELGKIIDQVPALARSCRQDGTTEFLSRRWLDYTGLTEKKALGWGWKNAIPPEDSEKLMETWLRRLDSGEVIEDEVRLTRFDGEYRWFLVRATPVRDEQGNLIRCVGTNTDIDDLKRLQSLLSTERQVLEESADFQSDWR